MRLGLLSTEVLKCSLDLYRQPFILFLLHKKSKVCQYSGCEYLAYHCGDDLVQTRIFFLSLKLMTRRVNLNYRIEGYRLSKNCNTQS
jgi:hypothetical protein